MKNLFLPTLLICILGLGISSCKSKDGKEAENNYSEARTRMEADAQKRLGVARNQLAQSRCAAAKKTVEKMRKDCYLALAARAEGILLMDSIDLRQAQLDLAYTDSLMREGVDSIGKSEFDEACRKVQFYERKIQYDKNRGK